MNHKQMGLARIAMAVAIAASTSIGCFGDPPDEDTGSIGMELQIAPGVTVNTVNWAITNTGTGFMRSGSTNVRFSNTISFQTGGSRPPPATRSRSQRPRSTARSPVVARRTSRSPPG